MHEPANYSHGVQSGLLPILVNGFIGTKPYSFIAVLPMAYFTLHHQSRGVETEATSPSNPQIVITWPFKEKGCPDIKDLPFPCRNSMVNSEVYSNVLLSSLRPKPQTGLLIRKFLIVSLILFILVISAPWWKMSKMPNGHSDLAK